MLFFKNPITKTWHYHIILKATQRKPLMRMEYYRKLSLRKDMALHKEWYEHDEQTTLIRFSELYVGYFTASA